MEVYARSLKRLKMNYFVKDMTKFYIFLGFPPPIPVPDSRPRNSGEGNSGGGIPGAGKRRGRSAPGMPGAGFWLPPPEPAPGIPGAGLNLFPELY